MSKVIFYPYPRLQSVKWSSLIASVEGVDCTFERLPDMWDSNAEVTFRVSALFEDKDFEIINSDISSARLVLEITCRDCAYSSAKEASFIRRVDSFEAMAEATVTGGSVSESIEISASIIAPMDKVPWLRRRIISDGPRAHIPLSSDLVGFPTSAFSFDEEQLPAAPWRLLVTAEDVEAPFAHSVRLELNEDFSIVREFIEGKANASVRSELVSSITRVLIGTVAGVMKSSNESRSAEEIAKESPDSITAAASRAAGHYLGITLDAAIGLYIRQPELFDYKLLSGSDLFRIK